MKTYAVFEQGSAAILKIVTCSEKDIKLNVSPGQQYLRCNDSVSDETHFISGSRIYKKRFAVTPEKISVAPNEIVEINLPEPAYVHLPEGTYFDDDGKLQLEFDTPGTYVLSFTMERYYTNEVTIHVYED